MQIVLNGTKVTQDKKNIGFKNDNLVETIYVTVDTPSSYSYKLDIQYPKESCSKEQLYNIIDLPRNGNLCILPLTMDMLPFNGKYICQIRGISGEEVYHTDTFECWVKYSIDPSEAYEPMPSEFYQVEDRINEYNNHPPYPDSDSGYWMIWNVNTHEYEQSTVPIGAQLPSIDDTTQGKYLSNDGQNALWRNVPVVPDVSESTKGKVLGNDGTQVKWVDGADKSYIFTQSTAESIWNIHHNLDKYPSVVVVDTGGNVVTGDIEYSTKNTVTIIFTAAFSGSAYLN